MRRFFTAITAVLTAATLTAWSQTLSREEYIEKYKETAIEAMRTHGIPASITLAQGCLESGDGNSDLAVKANNHFGIKCHNDWKGPTYYKKDDDPGKSCFRKYRNPAESFRDHSDFLRYRERYAFLFDLEITDYKGWCYGLKKAGYATDPQYAQRLIKIIEDYRLYRFDQEMYARAQKNSRLLPPSPNELTKIMELRPSAKSYLYKFSTLRTIYIRNGVPYILAGDMDTYASIAEEFNLFTKEILRYNDLKKSIPLTPGTPVYLQSKKKKAQRHLDVHIAVEGDTYYEVAQRYGIRLKSLFKYNDYKEGDILHVGDEIFLRKRR
ncbi:MAG TPA: glucosaminidase domain-containing protein [Candidatus Coprenecus stercoravium]|uniref:Peptidoglycan hydrolase n=1 Tax=Candidatus Coprenecus stercoravium TaxID=2840735 RepID=A0A9D2GRG7_9BACT|nr:glucosaminidase domain-containing protein [Candidatus Coprenecus stercoravium]